MPIFLARLMGMGMGMRMICGDFFAANFKLKIISLSFKLVSEPQVFIILISQQNTCNFAQERLQLYAAHSSGGL